MKHLIFIFSILIIGADTAVSLIKKRVHDGLKFSRIVKYTNETIVDMKQNLNANMTQELSLDVLFVADFSTYQAFLEMTNGDVGSAQHYVNIYLGAIFEQTKLIYENFKFGDKTLKLTFSGTFTAYREEDCPLWLSWQEELEADKELLDEFDYDNSTEFSNSTDVFATNGTSGQKFNSYVDVTLDELQEANTTDMTLQIDSKKAIDKFTLWIKKYAEFLPKHEHAVLITKFDLVTVNGHSATQGMAYVGHICQLGESSSVVEDIGASLTALIAAHEIGHSLGAFHDGSSEAKDCDSNDNYLLATSVSGSSNRETFLNSRRMSNCSIESIMKNLRNPSASCIKKWKSKSEKKVHKEFAKKPGESITIMQQCQISFGPTYGNCLNLGYYHGKSICERVWCSNRNDKSNDQCTTLNYFPAFDGTECGYNMWCIEGECVRNPKKWLDCKDLNAKTCTRYSASKLKHFCKSKAFREICCRTCAKKVKS
ncbi:unnamed protein product [Caenorhabditis bovis]|uniref:Peptidase M12B domain-containing protein n=1 Tax=Caenorhabditis bovis TaxID=2654633 RepID=A0A8S1EBL4_9PELO|nr:unnamed protein product [Caenorhabditis bovis]